MSSTPVPPIDLNEQRIRDALVAVSPTKAGRRLLICTMTGCAPCKELLAALTSAIDDDSSIGVSNLEKGDVLMRTRHIKLGARTYPTTLLIENNEIVNTISGFERQDDAISTEAYRSFLHRS